MLLEKQFFNERPTRFQEVYKSPEMLLLADLDDLIDLNFREYKDSDFYSGKLNLTTRILNASTRLYRNKTVFELIQDRVVAEAKLLLRHSRLSVKLITYDLGFEDPAYFCRFFKKMTGFTPQQYRKNCDEIENKK